MQQIENNVADGWLQMKCRTKSYETSKTKCWLCFYTIIGNFFSKWCERELLWKKNPLYNQNGHKCTDIKLLTSQT